MQEQGGACILGCGRSGTPGADSLCHTLCNLQENSLPQNVRLQYRTMVLNGSTI